MKRKILLFLVVLMLSVSVIANAAVKVDIFQFKVETKEALEKAANLYMKKNSDVTINIQTVGGGNDYGAALRSRFASGNEPTIFNVGGPQDVKDWMNYLDDLSDQPWVDLAYKGVLSGVTVNGGVYGLPFNQEGYGFIYNKAIFRKAGIDAESITSYDALVSAFEKLDKQKDKLGIKAVVAFPAKEKWVTGLHLSNVALSPGFGDVLTTFDSKKVDFKYGDQLQTLVDLQSKYAYKPAGTRASLNAVDYSTQVEELFSLGQVAVIQQGNWVYGSIASMDKELAQNIGLLPIPLRNVVEDSIPVGVPMYWAVNKKKGEAEKDAAKEFLNWIYTSPEGKKMIINDFKFIPALKGYDKLKPSDPLARDIIKYSEAEKTIPWVFMGYPSGWGEQVLGANIQAYLAGDMSWPELIKNCQDEWAAAR